jgi:hypothetical protein
VTRRPFVLLAVGCVLCFGGFTVAAVASKPPAPPGNNSVCEHGRSGKPCRPDPEPAHGQDCDLHGAHNQGNDDHCLGTTVSTSTSTAGSTSTSSTSSASTVTSTSSTTTGGTTSPTQPTSTTTSSASSSSSTEQTPTTSPTSTSTSAPAASTPPPSTPSSPTATPETKPPSSRGLSRRALTLALKRQAARPGTGRTSHANRPGQLPNTGLPSWLVTLVGLTATLAGAALRRICTQQEERAS